MMDIANVAPVVGALVTAPVVVAVVQAIKFSELIPNRFLSLVSIVTGTVLGFGAYTFVADPLLVIAGFMSGLTATGLYEAVVTPIRGTSDDPSKLPTDAK